jgi:hypothetical protein
MATRKTSTKAKPRIKRSDYAKFTADVHTCQAPTSKRPQRVLVIKVPSLGFVCAVNFTAREYMLDEGRATKVTAVGAGGSMAPDWP